MAEEEQQPESPSAGGGKQPAAAKPESNGNRKIIMVVIFLIIISLLPSAAYGGIFFSLYKYLKREPAPNTLGLVGQTTCATWSSAPVGYQTAFTSAANKFQIQPAVVGAVFLSEHNGSWTGPDNNGSWKTSSAGAKGPFQFLDATFASQWNYIKQKGFASIVSNGNVEDINDASLAAAAYSSVLIHNGAGADYDTTNENDIKCVGLAYNAGEGRCTIWKKNNYDDSSLKSVLGGDWQGAMNYKDKFWDYFQNLNVGCSAVGSIAAQGLAVPFMSQCDSPWATENPTGTSGAKLSVDICHSGCGLTSMAMIVDFLNNTQLTPYNIGTELPSPKVQDPTVIGPKNGLKVALLGTANTESFPTDQIQTQLNAGHPVLWQIRGSGGYKADNGKSIHNSGHFVVITKIDTIKNQIITDNPAGRIITGGESGIGFAFSMDLSRFHNNGGFNFWAFSKL